MDTFISKVSIGVPVYNGENTLRPALDSLLNQSFTDFELIISDNASTDGTQLICQEYADRDQRVRYIRHEKNLGPAVNFKYALDQARGEYFMWAACDDIRSSDFIEVNFRFLSDNQDYVASTSPNGFEGQTLDKATLVSFALDGDAYARFVQFFVNCWVSHGIFYSLVRTNVLQGCGVLGQSFIAADWAINLYLASCGKIHRTSNAYTVFGIKGVSSRAGAYKAFRNSYIEVFFPFYRLAGYVFSLTRSLPVGQRLAIMLRLLRLNIGAVWGQFVSTLYLGYCSVFKADTHQDKVNVNAK